MFNVRPQIVKPSQSATFPTSLQTWSRNKRKIWERNLRERVVMKWVDHCLGQSSSPAFCGSAIQFPPVPYFSMYTLSFESSSGDHGPFFTFALSQQGALPISLSLSLRVWVFVGSVSLCEKCWSLGYISPSLLESKLSLTSEMKFGLDECLWHYNYY